MVIALLAVAYIVFSFAELESILAVLRQSKPLYLGVAIVVEAVLLLNTTATFLSLYRLVGLRESTPRLFLMVTAATFVNLVTPFSGIGGMAVFLDEARRRSLSIGRVMVTGVLYILYEYVALFVALAAGFGVLAHLGKLNVVELLAAGFVLALAIFIGASLVVGYRSPRQLGILLAWLARAFNRLLRPFLHKETINIASVYTFSNEMTDGLSSLRVANPGQILLPLVFTLINKLLLILVLALAFLALDTPVNGETVVAGFSIGHLFVYASPTPSGIGFVDSILPMALNSLDVPFPSAVLVALVYRAVTLWLPLVLGALAFRTLQRSRSQG
ncbi:MAG: lysylphosphatidylglycerol synthase transmembrane domain-containing protein [Anaerolineales bacterium]